GNGHDGTVNGATLTDDRFGTPGSAYEFDGVDDNIVIPHHDDFAFNPPSFSVSLWARFCAPQDQGRLFAKDLAYSVRFFYPDVIDFKIESPEGVAEADNAGVPPYYPLDDGLWHHIVTVAYCDENGGYDSLII